MEFIAQTKYKIDSIFGIYTDYIFGVPYLLTESEQIFFNRLFDLLKDSHYFICPKVRVGDIVQIPEKRWHRKWYSIGRPWVVSSKIDRNHVDFLLIDKKTSWIAFAIELDDISHSTLSAKYHDRIKNEAFEAAKIPLERFQSHFLTREQLVEKGILK